MGRARGAGRGHVSSGAPGANEHGVFCQHERIEIAKTPHAHAAVLIAESGNGLFGYGIDYGYQMGGGHCFPCVWREAFGSRDEARAAGVADLIEHLGRGGDKRQAELLRKVKAERDAADAVRLSNRDCALPVRAGIRDRIRHVHKEPSHERRTHREPVGQLRPHFRRAGEGRSASSARATPRKTTWSGCRMELQAIRRDLGVARAARGRSRGARGLTRRPTPRYPRRMTAEDANALLKRMQFTYRTPADIRGNPEAVEERLRIYRHALEPFDADVLDRAWLKAAAGHRYPQWPDCVDIVEAAEQFHALKYPKAKVDESWVEKATALTDAYMSPVYADDAGGGSVPGSAGTSAELKRVRPRGRVGPEPDDLRPGAHRVRLQASCSPEGERDKAAEDDGSEGAREQASPAAIRVRLPQAQIERWREAADKGRAR